MEQLVGDEALSGSPGDSVPALRGRRAARLRQGPAPSGHERDVQRGEPAARPKEGQGYLYAVDEGIVDELDEYRERFDLSLGLYVQENDCDAAAVKLLSELVAVREDVRARLRLGRRARRGVDRVGLGDHRGFGLQRVLGQVGVAATWKRARAR